MTPEQQTKRKQEYQSYLKSEEWRNLKIDLLKIRGCVCEKCHKKKIPSGLHIHHLTYERIYNEHANDLMILCAICHMKEHGLIKQKTKKVIARIQKPKKAKVLQNTKKREHNEREANNKFIGNKRRKMKGKSLAAWQQ